MPPAGTLAYATPMGYGAGDGGSPYEAAAVWADGKQVVAGRDVPLLPERCAKCGEPADGRPWERTMYWHHPALFILILFPGLIIYVIVALIVRQKTRVVAGLCPAHRRVRSNAILTGWLIALAGVAAIVGGMVVGSGSRQDEHWIVIGWFSGIGLLLLGAIYGIVRSQVVAPTKMDRGFVWFKGAGPGFLHSLPPANRY